MPHTPHPFEGPTYEGLNVDQPRSTLDVVMWIGLAVLVISSFLWWLTGTTGLKIFVAVLLAVAYFVTVFKERDVPIGLIRIVATVIVAVFIALMLITQIPLLFAEFFSPIAQGIQDGGDEGGILGSGLMTLFAVVTGLAGLAAAAYFWLRTNIGMILLSAVFMMVPTFWLMAMIMQEQLR
jgi:hypothetical protein